MMTDPSTAIDLDPEAVDFWYRMGKSPGAFAREVCNMEPTLHQDKVFNALEEGEKRIAARSGHGVGKTAAIAIIVLWFLSTRPSCLIIVTAAKEDQIKKQIWAEARLWLSRSNYLDELITIMKLEMYSNLNPDGAQALGRVARKEKTETLQGFHHDHLLVIGDEASGIEDVVFEPVEGMLTKEDNIAIFTGNPTRATGYFKECFSDPQYAKLHFNSEDSPLVTQEYIDNMARKHGKKSNIYRVRVLGDFPEADSDSLINLAVVEDAKDRMESLEGGEIQPPFIVGLDPGRSVAHDASGLVARTGCRIPDMEQLWTRDSMDLVGRARNFRDRVKAETGLEFSHFCVDTIGLGGPIHDRLVELGEESKEVNSALPPIGNLKGYRPKGLPEPANVRAEMWLEMLYWLQDYGMIDVDNDLSEVLCSELVGPGYKNDSVGRVLIEAKEHMVSRGLSSPNLADGLALTFCEGTGPKTFSAYT